MKAYGDWLLGLSRWSVLNMLLAAKSYSYYQWAHWESNYYFVCINFGFTSMISSCYIWHAYCLCCRVIILSNYASMNFFLMFVCILQDNVEFVAPSIVGFFISYFHLNLVTLFYVNGSLWVFYVLMNSSWLIHWFILCRRGWRYCCIF